MRMKSVIVLVCSLIAVTKCQSSRTLRPEQPFNEVAANSLNSNPFDLFTHAPRKKPFYIVANLPYLIKRGEVVRIQLQLFSVLNSDILTNVTMFIKNDEIELVDRLSNNTHFRTKTIIVPHNQVKSISFLIKAKKLGEISIKIEAVNQLESDELEHMLRVIPEGRLYHYTGIRFIDLPTISTMFFSIKCDIPRDADPGPTEIDVFVDPILMGFLEQHTDSLLKIPTGASKSNLLTFVPNIVLLEYLKETGKVTPSVEQARNYVSSGYKNQLKYKHSNGAFGQWNPPRGNPSVFLTALVANALAIASKHIDIDKKIVEQAYSWISGKQKPNGCFEDDGEVIYTPLQNNSSSFALTAFIVSAIMENENIASQFAAVVQKATNCLAGNFDSLNNMHDIALATYALALVRHKKRQTYLDRLLTDSIFKRGSTFGVRYWDEELNVEIAAYALLASLQIEDRIAAIPIITWLNKQRYSTGDFSGVQRTFVALKALGRTATYFNQTKNAYKVRISYDTLHTQVDVQSMGRLKTFHHKLPGSVRAFNIRFDGIGLGVLQWAYQYHRNIQTAQRGFYLNVTVLDTSNYNVQELRICLSYVPMESFVESVDALVEVYLPSGLIVDEFAVRDISRQIQKTERVSDNTAMFVYYNRLGTNTVCFEITAYRMFQIAMHRPSYVAVHDTHDKTLYAFETYEGKVLPVCEIYDDEDRKSLNC
ncbi:CD109 antigen-like [Aedes aegypti]|uniref:Alpha-macroglobulin receptor-binding domain-containing protein n=1 Tax=Aedes aegypti TaxID=7159 RepID=A0A6I8U6Q8_AEDAE|nr:CD109 antigen-like [Aedes aegypti]